MTKNIRKINVAIIGIGHLGSRHLKVYSELKNLVNLVGVCDIKEERTERLARHYRVPFFEDYRELVGKVDAVNICVPTTLHYEIGKFFLEHGIHTFIEKPITMDVAQADELIKLAEQHDLKLQVGHVERFNSAFMAIKHFTKHPLFIECHRLNKFPNRSLDIGVVMDLMIHDIDIILGINNSPVKDFHGVGINVLTSMEDIASVRVIFENGCVCNLTASRVSDEVMRKIRIFTVDSYISLDYVKQQAFIFRKHGALISKHALPIQKEEPLKEELKSFVECVRDDKIPVVSGVEGRDALKLALKICEAIKGAQDQIAERIKLATLASQT
ncbi:MAG: Gfo/Idh/MocA family oxidoreductase [Candidatus Omnitrophica bacterium]|nr:Gfo/Idh/MocA family oxidoreductase [Candidatus Omnitrophota bacterium]